MKKLIAMILALVAVLSLCACGGKETTTEPEKQITSGDSGETQPDAPQIPNLDMFVGKWNIYPNETSDEVLTFTVNADGTLEKNGDTLTWTVRQAHPDRDYEMILEAEYPADPNFPDSEPFWAFELYLTRTPEDTYVAEMMRSQMATMGDMYYRECDYEVVGMTTENAMEYLQCEEHYTFNKRTSMTDVYELQRYTTITFKEGLGAPSHCIGDLCFQVTTVEVTLGGDDGYTEGQILRTDEEMGGTRFTSFALDTKYPYEFYYTYSWYGNEGDPELTEVRRVDKREMVGAVEMTGYVFIPV